jgi:tungstate transport system ATP-binding protein
MPAVFTCENLSLAHNGAEVLSVPAFTFDSGQIYALLGPNGSGKTTLLRAMNGFLKPRRGRILFFGEPLYGTPGNIVAKRRRMCLVAQSPVLFDASLMYNVCYGLRARGQGKKQAMVAAREAIERVGLSRYERTNAQLLSGGEAQRAAMARALAIRPDVLLLDEPTGNVDVDNTRIIEDIITAAVKDFHVTVVFSTHSRRQARRIAHHAVHLHSGALHAASPEDPAGYMWSDCEKH